MAAKKKATKKTPKGHPMRLGGGGRFAALSAKVAASERKKGKSAKEARRIGDATAAKMGRKAHGKAMMAEMAAHGRAMAS